MPDKLYILMQDSGGDCLLCHGAFTSREKAEFYISANFKNTIYDAANDLWHNHLGDDIYGMLFIKEATVREWSDLWEQMIKKKLKKEK